ncbi:MAG: cysteine desulfurase [Vicinamibacterales bacterium]
MSQVLENRRSIGDRAAPHTMETRRADFPILQERIGPQPLVWLDNAATTQKPRAVIDRLVQYYTHENANVHRGGHALGTRATDAFEAARESAARFLNAPDHREIVFVRGTTEALNLVANSWGRVHVGKGDEILVTALEHHSNLVPWQMLAAATGARLRIVPIDADGQLDLDALDRLLNPAVKLVAVTHISNALGTIAPVREVVRRAHRVGAVVVVDGAQAVSHLAVDVQALDVDFYAFSGHKVFGPTGIGVLYARRDRLDEMTPWQGGGGMTADFDVERTVYQPAPQCFEAGTPSIGDAVALGSALEYVRSVGFDHIEAHDRALTAYTVRRLSTVPHLQHVGTATEKLGVVSFVIAGVDAREIGGALDREGIAVRVGQHCALPALRSLGVSTIVRVSLALYNTQEDIDALVAALTRLSSTVTRGEAQ